MKTFFSNIWNFIIGLIVVALVIALAIVAIPILIGIVVFAIVCFFVWGIIAVIKS